MSAMQLRLGVTEYLSNFMNVPLGKQAQEMDISPQLDAYSGVEIIIDDETSVFAGNRAGRVLEIQNPWGTQEQANAILSSLTSTGFQYQPYTATGALLNPAAEIGDGVTVNGVYSGIYKIDRNYNSLMAADIEAPQDEAIDHEYPYEPQQDRIYKREIGEAKAQIAINSDSITALVQRADATESSVTTLEQTATTLSATAMTKTGGSSQSFGWNLNDTSWTLTSNNSEVLKATSDGISVRGNITATSGFIGNGSSGFTITASSIYNGMSSLNNTSDYGIYIGTDGIALGKGAFKVTSSGSVSANNMTLNGTLTIGGQNISASSLYTGASQAASGYGGWNSAASTVSSNGAYWSTGAGYGYTANNAFNNNAEVSYMKAKYLTCTSSWFTVGSYSASWKSRTVVGSLIVTRAYNSTLGQYVVSNVGKTDATIYYLGRT